MSQGDLSVASPVAAPVLSTPDSHIFASYTPASNPTHSKLADDALRTRYETQRTIREIRRRRWKRIALQFPDHMLPDAPRVYELLKDGFRSLPREELPEGIRGNATEDLERDMSSVNLAENKEDRDTSLKSQETEEEKLYILGDTSYGACCVDEVAAEHVAADAVVHYGRACLSPTARLPVLHIFTIQPLETSSLVETFEATYREKDSKVLLVADVTYSSHIPALEIALKRRGYTSVFATDIVHNPSSAVPNRTTPPNLVPAEAVDGESRLAGWHLFHISNPPPALLLTLTSRVSSIRIFSTDGKEVEGKKPTTPAPSASLATPMPLLRRRYALLTRLRSASIVGILINTLSASSTLPVLARLRSLIAAAGKKAYTVVVGKVNAAKLANFAEVDGWVVVGCWESSLLDDDEGKGGSGWWKPCVTPWELEAALGPEGGGLVGWRTDLENLLERAAAANEDEKQKKKQQKKKEKTEDWQRDGQEEGPEAGRADGNENDYDDAGPLADEEESEPPDFDLRTGKYVSTARPMMRSTATASSKPVEPGVLTKRAKGDLAVINGEASPGAAFLREKRTWRGLGSDFEIAYEDDAGGAGDKGALIEDGRSGIARGYGEEREDRKP